MLGGGGAIFVMYCYRIALTHSSRMFATDTPTQLTQVVFRQHIVIIQFGTTIVSFGHTALPL